MAAVLLLSGCFWLDGPESTFDPNGPVARHQMDLFYVTCWVTFSIFVIVAGVLAYATIKFKARAGRTSTPNHRPRATAIPLLRWS